MNELFVKCLWEGFLGAGLATMGFGVLFNVRSKNLLLAALTGAAGGVVYIALSSLKWPEGLANFMAAMVIGTLGEIFARKCRTTVTTFTAPALIPLVPGGTAYEMMVQFATGEIATGITKLISMLSISGMLAMGILVVSTLTRFFFYSKRQVKKTHEKLMRVQQQLAGRGIRPKTNVRKSAAALIDDEKSKDAGGSNPCCPVIPENELDQNVSNAKERHFREEDFQTSQYKIPEFKDSSSNSDN